jgi:hypothetical protein
MAHLGLLLVATRERTNPWVFFLIVWGVLAAMILLACLLKRFNDRSASRREFRRSFEIAEMLKNHGMALASSTPFGARLALLQPFELGRRGDAKIVRHFMESSPEIEQRIWIMDYSYFESEGYRRVRRSVTVALVGRPGIDLPRFYLSKELPFQWLERVAKAHDIDFEEQPTFNQLFRLTGESETAVRELFSLRIRDALEQHPGLTIEGRGSQLLIFRELTVLAPDRWPEFLEETRNVAQLFAA